MTEQDNAPRQPEEDPGLIEVWRWDEAPKDLSMVFGAGQAWLARMTPDTKQPPWMRGTVVFREHEEYMLVGWTP